MLLLSLLHKLAYVSPYAFMLTICAYGSPFTFMLTLCTSIVVRMYICMYVEFKEKMMLIYIVGVGALEDSLITVGKSCSTCGLGC